MKFNKNRGMPLILTGVIVAVDQVIKAIIAAFWPIILTEDGYRSRIIANVIGEDFLRITHVRNTAIAFSLGRDLPEALQPVLFIVLPLLVLGVLVWYYLRSNDFTGLQRWAVAGILGGGIGNLIDRIFRPDGVIDFIDFKFYGIFGFERWPTFNIADASVVVCCLLLFVSLIIIGIKKPKSIKRKTVK